MDEKEATLSATDRRQKVENLPILKEFIETQEFQDIATGSLRFASYIYRAIETNIKPIVTFLESVQIAQTRAAKWLVEHQEQIEHALQVLPRLQKAFQSSEKIGHLGWTVSEDMEVTDIVHLAECKDAEDADAYMLMYYKENDPELLKLEERLKQIEYFRPYTTVLPQLFTAFRNDQFALVIPLLISVLERALRQFDIPRPHPNNEMIRIVQKKLKQVENKTHIAFMHIAFTMKSLTAFTGDMYGQYNSKHNVTSSVRRHGIMHGTQVPPNERVEVIRLCHVIYTASSLHKSLVKMP